MVQASFQPLRTSEPEEDDDCEPGDWEGAEDDVLLERLQPSTGCGSSRQVGPMAGRLGLGVLRNLKAVGAVALLVAGALTVSLLAARSTADGLRAARARTQDSVEEDSVAQTGSNDCHCCCTNCGCDQGAVAYCSSWGCPAGYLQREGAEHIPCRGGVCTMDDLGTCCNRRATCETYTCQPGYSLKAGAASQFCEGGACGPQDNSVCCELRATCDDYECPSNMALKSSAVNVMCAGGSCSQSDCCDEIPGAQVEVEKEQVVEVEKPEQKEVVVDKAQEQDIMLCNINCFNEGVDSVSVELPEDEVKNLDSCRDACNKNEECSAILFKKDFQTTGEGACLGKKDVHTALCQPGGDFFTEILKHRPWGKCALLGDPHLMQWDRPPQLAKPTFDDYDAGDYVLMASQEITIHVRFGFTERFPEATSTKGIAVTGSKVANKALVAGYSEKQKRYIAWYDGKEIIQAKGETFDDGLLTAKYDDMDPTDFHSEARHTLGEDAERVPSWTFEWKAVPLKVYMLLGPDAVNVVLEMQKLEYPMDGLCGNFNCDPDDEDAAALAVRSQTTVLSWQDSNFRLSDGTFSEKAFQRGAVDDDVLANCDPDLLAQGREACSKSGVDDAQAQACLLDVCEAKSVDVAALDVETVGVEEEVQVDIDHH